MYPHERSLVQRFEGKPFTLLGVNTDKNREEAKKVIQRERMTWRSWFDGPGGPITEQWQIRGFPAIYVIDAKGVIRAREVRGKTLDKAVDLLLKETNG